MGTQTTTIRVQQELAWFPCAKPSAAASLRLFCFPYAGAGSVAYRGWAEALPSVEVRPVLLPGRETRLRETPFHDPETLIETLAGETRPLLDRPYAFFGHSLGALIAFALARRLRALPAPLPKHLFLSGRRAPHRPDSRPPIAHLPDASFVEAVQLRYNGIPQVILQDAELMSIFLPTLRADFSLLESFRFREEPPFDFPISIFGGSQDPGTSFEDLAGWRQYTTGAFSQHSLAGDHFFLQSQRVPLLQAISQGLAPYIQHSTGNS